MDIMNTLEERTTKINRRKLEGIQKKVDREGNETTNERECDTLRKQWTSNPEQMEYGDK